jgi:hypothetical protein
MKVAQNRADAMGKYNYKYNNCAMFTVKLYKDLE